MIRPIAVSIALLPLLAAASSNATPASSGQAADASVVPAASEVSSASTSILNASKPEGEPMAHIRATVRERYPEANIGTITASTVLPGWYELVVGKDIVYADPTGDRLIVGKVVDTRTRENLTKKSWAEAHLIDFKALPFASSIKTVRGKGERVVAIFEDPLCPYCQKLEQDIQGVQDVTIYRFLLPLESVHPGATIKSREIWCSKDRAAAWSNWMLKHTEPNKSDRCDADPLAMLLQTAAALNLDSTPTLVFADGHRYIGAIEPGVLEQELEKSLAN